MVALARLRVVAEFDPSWPRGEPDRLPEAPVRERFAGALVQRDHVSKELQANIRVGRVHTSGTDLFLVFDAGYITDDTPDPWTRQTPSPS